MSVTASSKKTPPSPALPQETPGEAQTVDSSRHKRVSQLREKGAAQVQEQAQEEPRKRRGRPPGSKNATKRKSAEPVDSEPSPAACAGWEEFLLQGNGIARRVDNALEIGSDTEFSMQLTKDEAKAGGRAIARAANAMGELAWLEPYIPWIGLVAWGAMVTVPRIFIAAKAFEIKRAREESQEAKPADVISISSASKTAT